MHNKHCINYKQATNIKFVFLQYKKQTRVLFIIQVQRRNNETLQNTWLVYYTILLA
jgi:hypothetical protein